MVVLLGKSHPQEEPMAAALSLASIVLGAALAYVAERHPAHVEALETGGGVLLIAGLALLGSALPQA
jgi:hypothetical protein